MINLPKKNKPEKAKKSVSKERNWYRDRYEYIHIQRNFLIICVLALIVIFGFTITGVIELNSKKVYEPFIVQIEENTGIITKVNNNEVRSLPAEKAVRNATLVRYVLARESYNFTDYNFNYYQIVRLMSDSNVYRQFSNALDPKNPESYISYGFDRKVDVRIKSLIELDPKQNLLQVRIGKVIVSSGQKVSKDYFEKNEKSYIITLKYQYRDLDLSETERYILSLIHI